MIRQLLFLALASASLGACDWGAGKPPPPPPPGPNRPPPPETPVEWITADPQCRGSLRRGEWLVCDNQHVRYLHRTLALQWQEARRTADRRQLRLMQRQQEALLTERRLCEDADCVATAYRRYVSGYARPGPTPTAKPTPAWTPRPHPRKPVKLHRPHTSRGDWQYPDWRPNRRRGERSCAAEIGGSASAYLVRQCRVVNGRWDRSCTADMTCDELREQIGEGCSGRDRKPGFCNRR